MQQSIKTNSCYVKTYWAVTDSDSFVGHFTLEQKGGEIYYRESLSIDR